MTTIFFCYVCSTLDHFTIYYIPFTFDQRSKTTNMFLIGSLTNDNKSATNTDKAVVEQTIFFVISKNKSQIEGVYLYGGPVQYSPKP